MHMPPIKQSIPAGSSSLESRPSGARVPHGKLFRLSNQPPRNLDFGFAASCRGNAPLWGMLRVMGVMGGDKLHRGRAEVEFKLQTSWPCLASPVPSG